MSHVFHATLQVDLVGQKFLWVIFNIGWIIDVNMRYFRYFLKLKHSVRFCRKVSCIAPVNACNQPQSVRKLVCSVAVDGHTTKQISYGCSCYIQICCSLDEMLTLRLRPRIDISTSGQHIWMSHSRTCVICILLHVMHLFTCWYVQCASKHFTPSWGFLKKYFPSD